MKIDTLIFNVWIKKSSVSNIPTNLTDVCKEIIIIEVLLIQTKRARISLTLALLISAFHEHYAVFNSV